MNKKVILITGASRGIGYELTKLIVQHNKFIVLFSTRNEIKGKILLEEFSNVSNDVYYFFLDVSDHNSFPTLVKAIIQKFGSIDFLINNAGAYLDSPDLNEFPSFLDVTRDILIRTLDVNLFGCMFLCQLLMPFLNDDSLIINISSGSGKLNTTDDRSGHIAYRLSKSALNAFTRSLSKQYQYNKIKIISVCPGWVQTDMGGPNAPRTINEAANDILNIIFDYQNIESGSFLYKSKKQNL